MSEQTAASALGWIVHRRALRTAAGQRRELLLLSVGARGWGAGGLPSPAEQSLIRLTRPRGRSSGLMAGAIGGVVYVILSIPVQMITGPIQQQWMERILSSNPDITPEMRDMAEGLARSSGLQLIRGIISIVVFSLFGLLGGLIGVAVFKRNLPPPPPPGTIDITPSPMAPPPPPAAARRGLGPSRRVTRARRARRRQPYSFSHSDPKFPSVKVCSRTRGRIPVIPGCLPGVFGAVAPIVDQCSHVRILLRFSRKALQPDA